MRKPYTEAPKRQSAPWIEDEKGKVIQPFKGFKLPHYTQVPDEVFDEVMPHVTFAEFKCLCYIIRRTFGFGKDRDMIRIKQFSTGLARKHDEEIEHLNGGTGLSERQIQDALRKLEERGLILSEERFDENGRTLPRVYRLNVLPG